MFMDEARFGRISDTRCCWCPKPFRPMCDAMVSQEYTYAYATVSVRDGNMDSLILPYVNGDCMQVFLDEISTRYRDDRMMMVLDGAGWHRNESLVVPDNIRLVRLPPYSPELNPVEHLWDDLRKSIFITWCLRVLTPSKIISKLHCEKWKMSRNESAPSSPGHGSLMHY
mgnify:CR=1 FL=1